MNTLILRNFFRFIFLFALQVLVFRNLNLGGIGFNYISIWVYPLALMLLPMSSPTSLNILVGFAYGLFIDNYYDTIGMHASTGVFVGFIRNWVLDSIEPSGGYKENISPTKKNLGFGWFLRFASTVLFLQCFWFFSVETFTFVYIKEILLRTISSFGASFIFVLIYMFVFDPIE
jgi:hypothetical protein